MRNILELQDCLSFFDALIWEYPLLRLRISLFGLNGNEHSSKVISECWDASKYNEARTLLQSNCG
jgi:hypothetical protein